jgi:hypothetical protein
MAEFVGTPTAPLAARVRIQACMTCDYVEKVGIFCNPASGDILSSTATNFLRSGILFLACPLTWQDIPKNSRANYQIY